ncbi:hypothetical protein BX600DRAFT_444545 [Xylariales sp. PMI_506]|nr:hypothetical protein BX600DRAFT_444545 [Xylariales sp. PMI_506]
MGWDIKQNGISTNHKVPYVRISVRPETDAGPDRWRLNSRMLKIQTGNTRETEGLHTQKYRRKSLAANKPVKRRILVRRRRAGRRNNTLEGDITAVKAQEAYLEDLKNRYYAHNGITKRRPENEGPIESFFLRSRHKLDYSTVVESQARRAYKLQ